MVFASALSASACAPWHLKHTLWKKNWPGFWGYSSPYGRRGSPFASSIHGDGPPGGGPASGNLHCGTPLTLGTNQYPSGTGWSVIAMTSLVSCNDRIASGIPLTG